MSEGMPNIEGGSHITPPEGSQKEAPKPFQPSWIMETPDEFANLDPRLQLRAKQLHKAPNSVVTSNYLRKHYQEIEDQVLKGDVSEDEADPLMAKIASKIESLETNVGTSADLRRRGSAPVETAMKDLTVQIGDLVGILRQSGELRPAAGAVGQPITAAESQTAELRDIFGRLPPGVEKARWVDVEYSQEFYTRFTPNMEPHFYTMIEETAERAEWDARWKLARAAFWKKVYSAQPDKLLENQDLIELTREQMEILYNIPGVAEAMKWYLEAIIEGSHTIKENEGDEKDKTLLKCGSGEEFEQFRKAMRASLSEEKDWNQKRRRNGGSSTARALSELERKSADAIAWNWIWCGNLIESVDSRYSVINININKDKITYKGEGRHGSLAPALCSDDLRAVFHPQEKFENKCSTGLEWGAFGKWGQTQMEHIARPFKVEKKQKEEQEKRERDEAEKRGIERVQNVFDIKYIFRAASSLNDFWAVARDQITEEVKVKEEKRRGTKRRTCTRNIPVNVPECYPTTSLRSFFEEYNLTEQILRGEIDWSEMNADLWKTSYVTVRMRKAVGLFEYFAGKVPYDEKKEREWVISLLDIFRRLRLEDSLGEKSFHNLKAWAFRASLGGVGKPQRPEVTSPLPLGVLSDFEKRLRHPIYGYLKSGFLGQLNGEGLEIR